MAACLMEKCCGCIELRTGCLIIGYANLIIELLLIIMGITGILGGTLNVASGNETSDNGYELGAGSTVLIIFVVMLVTIACYFLITIVLLVGVHQEKRGLIKVSMIGSAVALIIMTITTLAGVGISTSRYIASYGGCILLSIYYLLVIRSYYYQIRDSRSRTSTVYTKADTN